MSVELVNIHTAFHQGQYQSVLDFDISSLSPSNSLPAKILRYRAQIALGQADAVLSELRKDDGSADMAAVKVLAQFTKNPEAAQAKAKAIELSQSQAENLTVQLLCGTVLANVGMKEEAVALLTRHQGSLDAYVEGAALNEFMDAKGFVEQCGSSCSNSPVTIPSRSRQERSSACPKLGAG